MKDSAGNSTALRAPVVSVQIPLPLLESLQVAQGDLFALFVDTGREVLRAMMEQDRVALCGPKGKRLPGRAAVRAGWRAIARGVSTRGYRDVVDPLPASEVGRVTSKSAVSRRFVALSTERLRELTERPIGDLGIRAVLIDGSCSTTTRS